MIKNTPNLRFDGFTDEWKGWKLGNTLTKNSKKNKDLIFENVESVSNKYGFKKQTEQFEDYSIASADLSNYYVIKEKQFAYNPSRINVGSIAYKSLGEPTSIVSPLYVSFSTKEMLSDKYLWNWFKTSAFESQRQRLSEGGVRDTLSFNQLSEMLLNTPEYLEQQKIGSFFKQLDTTITLHQRKLELLKEQKKGFLQKMFPKTGAKVPELRFPEFTDDWEQRKLGTLAKIVRGASPRPIQDPKWFDIESDIGWLRIADVTEQDGRIYYLEQHISKLGQEKTRVLVEPHLLLSIAATVGKPVVNYVKTGVHDGFLIFLNAIFDREFMFQWLEMFRPKWQKYGQPGSQVNLNSELVRNQEILIPSNAEQKKIGNFFKQLDDTITLHQSKLDLLKKQKKAFLQQMFI